MTTTKLAIVSIATLSWLAIIGCAVVSNQSAGGTKMPKVRHYPPVSSEHPSIPLLQKKDQRPNGSGVVIADGWILTAKHVLPITTANGLWCGKPILHPTLDLALLPCPGLKSNGIILATRGPQLYDRLYYYGWHLGNALLKTEGFQGYPTSTASVPGIYGCSGGAVVNARGELVGIIKTVAYTFTSTKKDMYALPHITGYTSIVNETTLTWINNNIK